MEQYLCLSLGECFRILSSALNCRPQKVNAVVAYIKESGVDKLQDILDNKALGSSTVVTGLNFCLTEPNALRKLMNLGTEVLVYMGNREFHPKLYLIECGDEREYLIAGSANISRGAITGNNIEANILTSDGSTINKVEDLIEKIKQESRNAKDIIEEYEKKRNEILAKLDKHRIPLFSHKPILGMPTTPQEEEGKTDKEGLVPEGRTVTELPEDILQGASTDKTTAASSLIPLDHEAKEVSTNVMEEQRQGAAPKHAGETSNEPSSMDEQRSLPTIEKANAESELGELATGNELPDSTKQNTLLFDSYKLFHANEYLSLIHIIRTTTKGNVNVIKEVLENGTARIEGKAIIYNVVKGAGRLLLNLPKIPSIIGLSKTKSKKRKLRLRRKIFRALLARRYGFNIKGSKSKLVNALMKEEYLIKGRDYVIANMPLLARNNILAPSDTGWATITMGRQDNTVNVEILLKLRKDELSRTYSVEVNIIRKLRYLLTLLKDQSVDDEEIARELLGEDHSEDTERTKKGGAYRGSVLCQEDLLSSICDITNKYLATLKSLPRTARVASNCKFLNKMWEKLRETLCNGSQTLSELAKNTNNHRILEFLIYALSRESILNVEYAGGYTRKTMPKPRKAWSNIPLVHDRRGMAQILLFYMFTTGDNALRRKRREAFYGCINVSINQKYANRFCVTQ